MSAGKFNFLAEVGANFLQYLQYEDAAHNPIHITGLTIQMQVRECPGTTVLIEASTTNGKITITNGAAGQFEIDIKASEMDDLGSKNYLYDVILITDANNITRFLEGSFNVNPRITVPI